MFVAEHFPDCLLAVLGGSVSRAEATDRSDLDIVVLLGSEEDPFRKVYREHGWIIECYAVTPETFREYFDEGIRLGVPSLQRMLVEGLPIRGDDRAEGIIEEARTDLEYGPMPWSVFEIDRARYTISDYLEDVRGAEESWDRWFSANKLVASLCEFVLRTNNCWLGEGKHLYRALASCSKETAERLAAAMEALYRNDDIAPLERLCLDVLEPFGGYLLEGYEE